MVCDGCGAAVAYAAAVAVTVPLVARVYVAACLIACWIEWEYCTVLSRWCTHCTPFAARCDVIQCTWRARWMDMCGKQVSVLHRAGGTWLTLRANEMNERVGESAHAATERCSDRMWNTFFSAWNMNGMTVNCWLRENAEDDFVFPFWIIPTVLLFVERC